MPWPLPRARAQALAGVPARVLSKLTESQFEPAQPAGEPCSLKIEPVDVEEVVRSLRATLERSARQAGIEFLVLSPRLEALPPVLADRRRLEGALMNLAGNAIKYNRPNGVVRIRLSVPSAERVRVTVTNTGAGIAAERQGMLFQGCEEGGQAEALNGGMVRSLAITKYWVESMHGELGFWSLAGEGASFWVDLPMHRG